MGKSLYRVDNIDELHDALRQFDRFRQEPIYVIQYHESKHHTGRFFRYRVMFIDGVLMAGRIYTSDSWLVDITAARGMDEARRKAMRDEEIHWMNHPVEALGEENVEALSRVNDILGLDILGLDVGVTEDGVAVIFEANPNMNFLTMNRRADEIPYFGGASERITSAIENLLIKKAKYPVSVN
jgi:hypothetical protein